MYSKFVVGPAPDRKSFDLRRDNFVLYWKMVPATETDVEVLTRVVFFPFKMYWFAEFRITGEKLKA